MVLLGGTTYLLGLGLGSLVLTSLSEIYGRRPVHILSSGLHSLLVIPAALAPNPSAILASRFFGGFVVSASLSTSTGSVSDLISEKYRALAFSFWSLGAMNGAVIGIIEISLISLPKTKLIMTRADHGWLCIRTYGLAMDQLDCSNLQRGIVLCILPSEGDLCPSYPRETKKNTTPNKRNQLVEAP